MTGLIGHAGPELNLRTDMIGLTGHAGLEVNFFGPGCSPLFFFYHNTFFAIRTDMTGMEFLWTGMFSLVFFITTHYWLSEPT